MEIVLIAGQSNGGEMRERRNENESIRHNRPVHFNEVQTESVLETIESDKNITLADLDITVSTSYLYCQITHLFIFEVHSNFARMGIDFPQKKGNITG